MAKNTHTVRITGGVYNGQKLAAPGGKTHPMGERERLALFNMLLPHLPGAKVLDAYAGTGALGLEALSRGAAAVVFIENNGAAFRCLKQNLATLGLEHANEVRLVKGDVVKFAPHMQQDGGELLRDRQGSVSGALQDGQFDIILADPPYDNFDLTGVEYLTKFLKNGGILVLSHPAEAPELPDLKLDKTRKYAAAHISIYTKTEKSPES